MADGLRILKVLPFFSPALGGPAIQARSVCKELAARGHQVSVITSDLGFDASAPTDSWCQEDGFRVWRATTRSRQKSPPYPLPDLREVLTESARQSDALCLNVALTLWNVACRKLALRARIPYIYNAEGALCPERLRTKRLRKLAFLGLYERRILHDASALQAVTETEAKDLVRQGAASEKVRDIPNGVTLTDPPSPQATRAFREGLDIDEDAIVVLFLGRLTRLKGLDLLVEAATPVMHEEPRLVGVVAGPEEGEGDRAAHIAQRAGLASRFRWPGLLTGEAKRCALAAADLFALPSRSEGLPNSILEAAAAGLPLWITDRCNIPEVGRYDAGTADPPDAVRLSASLREHVGDMDRRCTRGQNARRMAEECFALDGVVDRLEQLYEELAE